MQATAHTAFLKTKDKRTKYDLCPVKLCVTHKRKQRYFSIREKLTKDEWQFIALDDIPKVTGDSPRGKYRDIAFEYDRIVREAKDIIKGIPVFSFNQFEERFYNKAGSWDNVFAALWNHIQDLKAENRLGYASSFESTLRAVKEYHTGKVFNFNPRKDKVDTRSEAYLTGKELRFVDITASWLKKFDKSMQEQDKSKSTIGIYVRNLRVLFNLAIKKHKVKAEYPFTEYKPKSADGRKMALTAHQISKIANYKTEHPQEQFYRDLFMFSFLGQGVNLSDIARLKYSDMKDGELCFVREKTKNETDKEVTLHIPITKNLKAIIDQHSRKAVGFDAYLFPILKPEWDEARKYAEIKQFTKQVNKYVRRVAKAVGINEPLSSYTARHSWATISKNSGASIEYIKEALGHSSVNVTEKYLKSFEKATRLEHAEKLENVIFNHKAV